MKKNTTIIILIITLILSGSMNTIISKIVYTYESLGVLFTHPWLITFLMFIGEFSCFIVYFFINKEQKSDKAEINPLKLSILPFFDLIASTLSNISLIFLPGSILQMLKSSILIFVFLLSIFVIKNKHNIYHFMGVIFVILGIILVGLSSFVAKKGNDSSNSNFLLLGIILVLLAQMVQTCQIIYEEKIVKNYFCHPLKCMGYEGLFGSIFSIIIMIILQFIKCVPNTIFCKGFCVSDNKGIYQISNFIFDIRQIYNNSIILIFILGFIIAAAVYNGSNIFLTGSTTGTCMIVADTIRTIFIWMFFMFNFAKRQEVKEHFSFIQLSGFIFLIIENLVYNEFFSIINKKGKKTFKGSETKYNNEELNLIRNNLK